MKRGNRKLWKYGLKVAFVLIGCALLFVISIYIGLWGAIPNKQELSDIQYQRASEVYSADSVLIGKYYLYDRQPVSYEDLPSQLVEALIAIEDRRFYDHKGVDYRSLFRVGFKTILLGDDSSGGGSTLSQQLAKNLYPRKRRNALYLVVDKFKEMIIASRLEKVFSKEEVIEHYLNTVSFGDNTYGIESASLRFFSKHVMELKTEEAAVLTGMLKATYLYNPRLFPNKSLIRRNTVLRAMEETGVLEAAQADSLAILPLTLYYQKYDHDSGIAPYFREEVRQLMEQWCQENKSEEKSYNLYTSGLKIYTTLNFNMQTLAEEVMHKHMSSLQSAFERSYGKKAPWLVDKSLIEKVARKSEAYTRLLEKGLSENEAWDSLNLKREMTLVNWEGEFTKPASSLDSLVHYMKFLNTGSVSIDPTSGAVKTWIGGIDYRRYKYDHVSQSRRQVGSTFKPIVYTAALEEGIGPCTYFSAQEVEYKNLEGWSPGNSSEKNETYLNYSMEEALSKSVNTVSVKVLEKTGIPAVINMAKKMGIRSPLPELPSLALGTGEIRLEELVGAYASYVNHGRPVTPYLIQTVTDNQGRILHKEAGGKQPEPAFSEHNRLLMLELMKSVVNQGTASRIRSKYGLKNDIAGKTGTTQNNKDAWFIAITPGLVHGSWVGLDHHEIGFKDTSLGQGASAALPLFALWMQELNRRPEFRPITSARFKNPGEQVLNDLDCKPVVRDNFFKRLFKIPKKKKSKKFKDNILLRYFFCFKVWDLFNGLLC